MICYPPLNDAAILIFDTGGGITRKSWIKRIHATSRLRPRWEKD